MALKSKGYFFSTFTNFFKDNNLENIILRHDVDKLPENSLQFAKIQYSYNIRGTYYFRIIPKIFNDLIIRKIADLGHEIGYHYETMDTCKGNIDLAYDVFCRNLEKLRRITEIKTISMHGSPLSKYDNREIWKKYDYKKLGIIGEPYFDVDFNEVLYLTDTGRRWDGWKASVRDKVPLQEQWIKKDLVFHSTKNIIKACKQDNLPDKIMMNFHPQRWHDDRWPWMKELIWQNVKNVGKYWLIRLYN